jgi:hypothetical protein
LDNLKQQLKQAQQNFDYADENHINAAIYELKAVVNEAARILKDYPHLKYYQAINMAKEVLEDEKQDTQKNKSN